MKGLQMRKVKPFCFNAASKDYSQSYGWWV